MTHDATTDLDRWIAPISAAYPVGKEARHEAEHEIVRAEVGKLGSIAATPVDWQRVELAASALLANKSKDLAMATYLACALHERNDLAGLAQGLELLTGLMQNFGQALFPPRPRARANALEWFLDRAASRLENASGTLPQVEGLRLTLQRFGVAVQNLLEHEGPSLAATRSALDRMALSASAALEPSAPAMHPDRAAQPQADAAASQGVLRSSEKPAAEAWLLPISDQHPAGIDASYSEGAALIRHELAKLESLSADKPNWQRVHDECDSLLRTQTKDLVIATQLTHALHALRGLEGLELGLTTTADILDTYWDSMWPALSRVRRRSNALSSLVERVATSLDPARAADSDPSILERLDQTVTRLVSKVAQRFGGDAPSFEPLQTALRKLRDEPRAETTHSAAATQVPAAIATSTPAEALPSAALPQAPPTMPAALEAPSDPAQIRDFLENTGRALVQAASSMRDSDPESALACRLLRTGVWLHIESLPNADAAGKTRIPPPDRRVRQALPTLVAGEQWTAVLAQTEGMLPRAPLWLDLQFYAASAHSGLGGGHTRLAALVRAEAQKFTQRLIGITQLRFSDASPLASPETLAWLEPPLPWAKAGASEPALSLPATLLEALRRNESGAAESLDLLLKSASVRATFYIRLELSTALVARGTLDSAIALLLGLEQELDVYQLERWEPELAQQVLAALWSALQSQRTTTGVVHPEAGRVCARLARLLPSALL